MNFLNPSVPSLQQLALEKKEEYQQASPFPNISFDNFFDEDMLSKVLDEFPDLAKERQIYYADNNNEKKLATLGETLLGDTTKSLVHYLNSQPMLEFLQELTGIKETLLPDPYLSGGGYHEIKPGGLLKVHADFNKHDMTHLDRRLNLLVYLNKDWDESYGGHFELWDKEMKKSEMKILPLFNRVALFSTTSFSYHGHPDPLTCPPDRSRKSLALYYYSKGRPAGEIIEGVKKHSTLFVGRDGVQDDVKFPVTLTSIIRDLTPPILFNAVKKLKGKR